MENEWLWTRKLTFFLLMGWLAINKSLNVDAFYGCGAIPLVIVSS